MRGGAFLLPKPHPCVRQALGAWAPVLDLPLSNLSLCRPCLDVCLTASFLPFPHFLFEVLELRQSLAPPQGCVRITVTLGSLPAQDTGV